MTSLFITDETEKEQETDSELNPHHHHKGLAHLQSKTQGRILWQGKTTEVCIHIHTHSSKSVGKVEQKGRVQGIGYYTVARGL